MCACEVFEKVWVRKMCVCARVCVCVVCVKSKREWVKSVCVQRGCIKVCAFVCGWVGWVSVCVCVKHVYVRECLCVGWVSVCVCM
jgi:hypothetical protein